MASFQKHLWESRVQEQPSSALRAGRAWEGQRGLAPNASAASETQLGSNKHHRLLWEFVWLDFSNIKLHRGHSLQNNHFPFSAQRFKCLFQISKFVLSKKKKTT